MRADWTVIGVAGATCAGKSTLVRKIKELRPDAVVLHHDDFFLPVEDSRHVRCVLSPTVEHINFELLSSLDNDKFVRAIMEVVNGEVSGAKSNLLLLDGFLLFHEPRVNALCNVKFYFTMDKTSCFERRRVRAYDPPDPPGYFEQIVWPAYLEQLKEVKENMKDVVFLDGTLSPDRVFEIAKKSLLSIISL